MTHRPPRPGALRGCRGAFARLVCAGAALGAFALGPVPALAADDGGRKADAKTRKPARPTASVAPIDVSDPREAQARQSAERDQLTARIAELRQRIAAGERSRSGAAQALQRAERALADVNRRIDELARRQRESEDRIAGLERQRAGTENTIGARRAAFGKTAAMLDATGTTASVLERDGDGGASLLDETYLVAAARQQAADLDALHGRVRDLQSQRLKADDDARALVAQAEAQRTARASLAADQAAQKKSLTQLSQQLEDQRRTANALEADEKRLTRVVEQLQRAIERQAAAERARRQAAEERARRDAEQKKGRTRPREPEPPTTVESIPDESTARGAFAQLRGTLRLPVRGTIVGRFGAARGPGGATWKGVFVRTESGAEVHAVAAGRVIFADDLRGFGNLLIVDHGDQYLSIYGNNQALLKHTGDVVKPGEVVAHAGNSIGDDQTGLYFELRHDGRPFDPLGWTGGR